VEATWLASQLEAGRSIESIAREVGLSASTVAYWATKHGLSSRHASKHAARGGIDRVELEAMVGLGMPIRAMADQLGVSYTTVRHWLKRHGLTTPRARRLAETAEARATGANTAHGLCPQHGPVTFVRRGPDGFRCQRCRTEAVERRRKIKRILRALRLFTNAGCPALPPCRSDGEVLRRRRSRRDALLGGRPRRGRQVRPALRHVSCRGRTRRQAATLSADDPWRCRGVIRRSSRLRG
jgi:transcriptional regulator with XRE-family HTH domain